MITARRVPSIAVHLLAASAAAAAPTAELWRAPRATTYSIVARDPATGQIGVAVQSHWFAVGPLVAWAEPGVGAVATQSLVRVDYGPDGLAGMRAGGAPAEVLARLVAEDDHPEVRQVAMVDARGRVAAHTGESCIAAAGHQLGEGYSVQANLMLDATVWPAMATAFESATGTLAERMLASLEAAQRAGGDIRGKQSAALVVVRAEATGKPWEDRLVDLRVDDHPRPLEELRRLLTLQQAYAHANRGDELIAADRPDAAMEAYAAAEALAPDNVELVFWRAVALTSIGRHADALPLYDRVFRGQPAWALVVPRLVASGLLPDDDETIGPILALAPRP